jgi:signal peptidase I
MEPQLRSGDFLMVAPASVYDGEGLYVLDFQGDGGCPYLAERVPVRGVSVVRIWHPNPAYSRHVIGLDEFNALVRAKAVADVRMRTPLHEVARLAG